MAIQATVKTIQGVQLESSYINLAQNPQIVKIKSEGVNTYFLSANANIYSSKEYYDDAMLDKKTPIPIEGVSVTCDLDLTKNVIDQAYAQLKRNERLTNIVDC